MATAAHLRARIEATLSDRVPAAFTLKIRQAPELFATGIAEADAVLDGGIPRGGLTEISGAASTGRTSFALSIISGITRSGAACAWVDVHDALSPESAAASGVVLDRLLWLRARPTELRLASGKPQRPTSEKLWPRLEQALKATDLLLQTGGFAAIVLDMGELLPRQTMRIPLATWYRFRLAAEQARTALILLTQSPCASSCAALVLRCEPAPSETWSAGGETSLFESQHTTLIRERNRNETSALTQKKPSARAEWHAQTEWTKVR
jgi:RecA/RadA recombinase